MRTTMLRMTALAAVIAVLGGCTEPELSKTPAPTATPTSTAESPRSTPAPTIDPAEAQAESEIIGAYLGYWDGVVASFAEPAQPQSPSLAANSDDTALTDAQAALIQLQGSGIHVVGEPILSPEVTSLSLNGAPNATIVDCVDASDWLPVFTLSGESAAAPDQATRLTYEATAFRPEDRWLIRTVTVHRDEPC